MSPKFWLGSSEAGSCSFYENTHVRFSQAPIRKVEVAKCERIEHVQEGPPRPGLKLALITPDGDFEDVEHINRALESAQPDDFTWYFPDPPRWPVKIGHTHIVKEPPAMASGPKAPGLQIGGVWARKA